MRFAIFSDLHDNFDGFYRVLMDAEQQHADRLIFLGDTGQNIQLFAELRQRGIVCTFGNWEVSGLRRLPAYLVEWVSMWPATLQIGQAIFCHATPNMPREAATTAAAAQYIAAGSGWGCPLSAPEPPRAGPLGGACGLRSCRSACGLSWSHPFANGVDLAGGSGWQTPVAFFYRAD